MTPKEQADEWNKRHPVGTPVTFYRLVNPLSDPVETKTSSKAWVIADHAVIMVENNVGCALLAGVIAKVTV
jgi:hypothetical protein